MLYTYYDNRKLCARWIDIDGWIVDGYQSTLFSTFKRIRRFGRYWRSLVVTLRRRLRVSSLVHFSIAISHRYSPVSTLNASPASILVYARPTITIRRPRLSRQQRIISANKLSSFEVPYEL